jgi:uncharacterized protein (DUF2235 family)
MVVSLFSLFPIQICSLRPFRDTVSSIGIARSPTLPETTKGMRHVCTFRHALALDERRIKFLPEYVNGGLGPTANDEAPLSASNDVKEVWFAGSHSDMYVDIISPLLSMD